MADDVPTRPATRSGTSPERVERSSTGGSSASHMTEVTALATDRGRTSIADGVVAKVAGLAAREIPGVYALGSGVSRAFAAMRKAVPGGRPDVARGVSVEVGEKQCAVDLSLVVEYGAPIAEVAAAVRDHVIESIERMTGLEVVEVDISVDDIHIEQDEDEGSTRNLA
ncbi:stress protein, Gls24 family [Embleya scabrispora]|uniref:Stress protein, Gls24 family n=1 Tax=Embleya scabrispora TaxID=159449 RepID=A0A1T3NXS1_9ACTN|nr:Asp23/Gls24 family envelope stress response protein [Embleya scabrispora]OPC81564.1 stress protein, Gls24 family [Embleya scabrispora]